MLENVASKKLPSQRARWQTVALASTASTSAAPVAAESVSKAGADWQWGLKLRGYGYGAQLNPAGTARAVAGAGQSSEFAYERGELREWYHNRSEGVEHGFTVQRAPQGREQGGPLRVALSVTGDLQPVAEADGVRFETAHGQQVLSYRKLRAWDARGQVLPARLSLERAAKGQPTEIVLAVDDGNAAYPVTIDPLIANEEARLAPVSSPDQDTLFGNVVALDGNTALIGTGVMFVNEQGAAYIFVRSGATWTLQQKLVPEPNSNMESFGRAVDLDGDTAVLTSTIPGGLTSVYVFTRNGTTWTKQQELPTPPTGDSIIYGFHLALQGDTLLVSNSEADSAAGTRSGAVFVYGRSGATWTFQQRLISSDDAANQYFGQALALDGNTAVVNSAVGVYVFVRNGALWTQQQKLDSGNGFFRGRVAVDGDTVLAAGQDFVDIRGTFVYVFVRTGATWMLQQKLIPSNPMPDQFNRPTFGASLALQGNVALIGADGSNATQSDPGKPGAAYIFLRSGTTWTQQVNLNAGATRPERGFGAAADLDGNTALVGAPTRSFVENGVPVKSAAYVFRLASDNMPPTISDISDQSINEDTVGTVNFTIGDAETAPADLVVTATSSKSKPGARCQSGARRQRCQSHPHRHATRQRVGHRDHHRHRGR